MAGWYFPPNNGGEQQGLNEAGVASFKAADSLARETTQNVLDNGSDSSQPRVIEFEQLALPRSAFPDIDDFCRKMKACRDWIRGSGGDGTGNEEKFFEKALALLAPEQLSIPTLRIRDINTTGLLGEDNERAKPFCRLLRVQGISSPQGAGGGTYGIGQRAPFHCSALRTVIYYTRRHDDHKEAFIAKAILCHFDDPDDPDVVLQAKGWWCEPNSAHPDRWRAIRDPNAIPPYFRRDEPGTDLYVTGFVLHGDRWEHVVRHAVLANFFAAIELNELVCVIRDESGKTTTLSSATLEQEFLRAAEEQRATDDIPLDDGVAAAYGYWKAMRQGPHCQLFEKDIDPIGTARFYVYRDQQNSQLPEKWCCMRKPHMVVDRRPSRVLTNFAGILICDNDHGNAYLAKLEGHEHRHWKAAELRNASDEEIKEAVRVERSIETFVRDSLKSLRAGAGSSLLEPATLGNYLPEEDGNAAAGSAAGLGPPGNGHPTTAAGAIRVVPVVQPLETTGKRRQQSSGVATVTVTGPTGPTRSTGRGGAGTSHSGGVGAAGGHGGHGVTAGGTAAGAALGSGPVGQAIKSTDVAFRSYSDGNSVKLILTASADITGDLTLVAQAEGGRHSPSILSAIDDGTGQTVIHTDSVLRNITLTKGVPKHFTVTLDGGGRLCLSTG
jgi:hypothetical protein